MRTCENCGNEDGDPYTFLYGTVSSVGAGTGTIRTTSEIKGRRTVDLGERCVTEFRAFKIRRAVIGLVVSSLLLLTGVGLFILGPSDGPRIVGGMGGAAAAIATMVFGNKYGLERRSTMQTHGEEVGIELHRKELKKQGHDGMWTQQAWADKLNAAAKQR